ncbi:MAG: cation transporter [Elusimicrobia bacterium]|nr:cation transporter [Elusimicrobiota bacterium]
MLELNAGRSRCEHPPAPGSSMRAAGLAFVLTGIFFIVELIGGWWTGSLALISDAMHMGVDMIALGMTLFAAVMSQKPPDAKRTFGYKRVEVLAALGNGVGLWIATGVILREAYGRFVFPLPVAAPQMLLIAGIGLVCNIISGSILYRSSRDNINLRGAFLHVWADAMGSLVAIGAGFIILKTRWYQADAIASVLICLGIVGTSFWLLRDSIHILLEGAPPHLDLEEIRSALSGLAGVREVHDLHLWSLSQGSESMSGHLVVEPGSDPAEVLKAGTQLLKERFSLSHITLQIERP